MNNFEGQGVCKVLLECKLQITGILSQTKKVTQFVMNSTATKWLWTSVQQKVTTKEGQEALFQTTYAHDITPQFSAHFYSGKFQYESQSTE